MNEREQMIELIGDVKVPIMQGDVTVGVRTIPYCEVVTLADYLLSHGATVQRWIPASDPPKEAGNYNVMLEGCRQATLLFYSVVNQEWESDIGVPYPVTHWMPLPEPPKKD